MNRSTRAKQNDPTLPRDYVVTYQDHNKHMETLPLLEPDDLIITEADINLCRGSGELLPCPFCGGYAISSGRKTENGKAIRWTILCATGSPGCTFIPDCTATVIGVHQDQDIARADAVRRWNRRIEKK